MADDDFDDLAMYTEEDQDDAAAAAAKKEAKEKRRQNFQISDKPTPPLSPRETARRQINDEMARRLYEYDPKINSSFYTRIWFLDFTKFDIDEETQFGPMHFTDSVIEEGHRENCQIVKSPGDSLILTDPSRGVVFLGDAYYEVNLKIREEGEERDDRNFSKVFEHVNGEKIKNLVHRLNFESWLSEVELVFAHVKKALEGTVYIKILSGPESFVRKITAYTTDLPLYDSSSVCGTTTVGAGTVGVIQLFRHVVAVTADQKLVFRIRDGTACISPPYTCSFSPLMNGAGMDVVPCGPYNLQVKVVWSILFGRR